VGILGAGRADEILLTPPADSEVSQ
jgi:hypothetical protein